MCCVRYIEQLKLVTYILTPWLIGNGSDIRLRQALGYKLNRVQLIDTCEMEFQLVMVRDNKHDTRLPFELLDAMFLHC